MGKFTKIAGGHGMTGSGVGHPKAMGVTGPGGNFVGTTMPQDVARNVGETSGENSGKAVPGNVGMKPHKTGGMSRKSAGVVGTGGYKGTT